MLAFNITFFYKIQTSSLRFAAELLDSTLYSKSN